MSNLSLKKLIFELHQKIGNFDADIIEKVDSLIESNGLGNDENVPLWLKNFFHLILQGNSTEKFYIDSTRPPSNEIDVWNFFAELEDVITIDYDDNGEEIEMVFMELGIYALISLESGFYQIQSSDDPSCVSYANEKFKTISGEST